MPVSIACPSCSRTLRVGDGLLGRKVKCPGCGHAFVAQAEPPDEEPPAEKQKVSAKPSPSKSARKPPPPPPPEEEPDEEPQDEEQQDEEPQDEDQEDERRPRKKKKRSRRSEADFQPHRGVLVMILGILATVFAAGGLVMICCLPPAAVISILALPLGIISWIIAARDLKQMREGMMDPSGRGMTTAGLVTGIIGTVLGALITLLGIGIIVLYVVGFAILSSQQGGGF